MERCEGRCQARSSRILWDLDVQVRFCPRCRTYWVDGDGERFSEIELGEDALRFQLRTRAVEIVRRKMAEHIRYQDLPPGKIK